MADGDVKTTTMMAALYKALARAQAAAAHGVGKDGRNERFGYDYTTAEAMIIEAKGLMSAEGLALLPLAHLIRHDAIDSEVTTKDGRVVNLGAAAILSCRYALVHVDGGCVEIAREWPIVPENGRPSDKATAAADTASLNYLLRDLLQLPRVEEGTDLDHESRDDHRQNTGPSEGDLRKAIGAELDRLGETAAEGRKQRVFAVFGRAPKTLADLKTVVDNLRLQPAPAKEAAESKADPSSAPAPAPAVGDGPGEPYDFPEFRHDDE